MINPGNVFYRQCNGGAAGARKNVYNADKRDSKMHAWLYQKNAYATATCGGVTLDTPSGGFSDMYKPGDGAKFLPPAHIESVRTSNEGDLGSLSKAEVTFRVYSINQLQTYQAFFVLGNELTVNIGWNDAGGYGSTTSFKGKVYNFSFTVNAQGGFDCTTQAIGPGIAVLSSYLNASKEDSRSIDANGITITAGSIAQTLAYIKSSQAIYTPNEYNPIVGYAPVKWPVNWEQSQNSNNLGNTQTTHAYISLSKLVDEINVLIRAVGGNISNIFIFCGPTITKGNMPTVTTDLASANPFEMLFPGYTSYNANPDTENIFSSIAGDFKSGDLSKILLNVDWLLKFVEESTKQRDSSGKSTDLTIGNFLNRIFDAIYVNSGTRFKLTIIQDPDKNASNYFYVVDANYMESKVTPFELTAVQDGGICRAMSLTSKVPDKMAAAAMIGGTSPLSGNTKATATIFGGTPQDNITEARTGLAKAIEPFRGGDPETLKSSISALASALERVYVADTSISKEGMPFPLDFSATIDGTDGFEFGHVVTTNYMPSIYKNKIAFTVTKVEHSVQGNDWTTTISTVCRARPHS